MIERPEVIQKRLLDALRGKGPHYTPRTKYMRENGQPEYINRLILENSPYLLQHAHNPVDWHAWGADAFERAKLENKPVFLSIGYSTCHWCHVMEHESFDNTEIARFLNNNFVCIKVDRELLPDVDALYMTAVMLTSGHGGWPMSSFLTHDGKPFFSGTYYPPGQFSDILQRVIQVWEGQRDDIEKQAEQIMAGVRRAMESRHESQLIDNTVINQALNNILSSYDPVDGGFGRAPKFPNEPYLFLLLEVLLRSGDKTLQAAMENSLDAMARGGIYDQIGGGFHRYSTDSHWLVPHFEKMLYNQANLARIYLRAYQIMGKTEYERIARETLDYVLREMTSPEGGFYSATDADSEGREGVFFLWDANEIEEALSPEEASLVIDLYNISAQGNFEGRNILYLPVSLQEYAARNRQSLSVLTGRLDPVRETLRKIRQKREAPLRDEKIITAWNGMMINAFAHAAMILREPRYHDAAVRAAHYILTKNRDHAGRFWRASLEKQSSTEARQEDYASFIEALVSLYDTTKDQLWLEEAEKAVHIMMEQFLDQETGGFFMNTSTTASTLPARPKETNDSAIPSGNSIAIRMLARLARRTGKEVYLHHAEAALAAFSGEIKQYPHAFSYMLTGAAELMGGEQDTLQFGGKGNIVADVIFSPDSPTPHLLTVTIKIAGGWHINAKQPLQANLRATEIRLDGDAHGWQLQGVEYPDPQLKKLGFQQEELALYENTIEIHAKLVRKVVNGPETWTIPRIRLDFQACNDALCLPPESLFLSLFQCRQE